MKLFFSPGSCSLACWIALEWAGADYEAVKVNPRDEAYQKINPLGMVPALDIGGARAMTQCPAILNYISERYPDKKLGPPDDINARFEYNETMAFLSGDLHPAFWTYFFPARYTIKTDEDSIEAVRQAAFSRIDRVMTHLDKLINTTGHVYGDRRTCTDAFAFVLSRWTKNLPKSWKDYPHIEPFMETMMGDPAVQSVLQRSREA